MKTSLFLLGLFTLFFHSKGNTQNELTLTINLRPNGSCYEIKPGKPDIVIKNDLGKEITLSIEPINLKKIQVPKEGKIMAYEEGENENLKIKETNVHFTKFMITTPILVKDDAGRMIINRKACPEVRNVNSPAANNSTNASNVSKYKFIPTREDERRFKQDTEINSCQSLPHSKDKQYEIIYNYQDHCFCYFEKGNQVKVSQKFNPRVDKELYFRVIGYHPYRDSLVIGTDFIDRNLEYEEQFLTVIEQGLPKKKDTPAPDEKDTPKPGGDVIDGQAEPDSTTDSLLVMSFRNEMVLFYNQKKNASSISIDFIESCIAFINEKILVEFGINLATPEAILEKGRDMLSGVEHEEVLLANLEEGVSFYQRILSYNTIAYFPVQVENADITKVTFQRYQNGKPMHPKPYVYKFFNGGGFKIDFSTGIIKHGLIDDRFKLSPIEITDTTYSVQNPSIIEKINTKTQGRIMQEKSSKFNISLGLLAHFYTRRMAGLNRFNLGLSTGVLLDKKDEDFQLKYLFGGSLLFGSERRWVLSGGAILGKVARLAEGLETGEKGSLLPYTPNTTNEVPTRDIFEYGWFVGVTYNLGKKKTE